MKRHFIILTDLKRRVHAMPWEVTQESTTVDQEAEGTSGKMSSVVSVRRNGQGKVNRLRIG